MNELVIKRLLRILLIAAGICALLYFLYLISEVLIIFAFSVLLAFILEPLVIKLEYKGFNRLFSIILIFASSIILVAAVFSYLVPNLALQMKQFVKTMQVISIHEQILSVEKEIYNYLPFFELGQLSKRFEEFISSGIIHSFDKITTFLSSIISIIVLVVIVPFITFFLLKDNKEILRGIVRVLPNRYFEMSYWILKKVTIQLGRYVRGWIFDAAFVGIACGLGYYVLGINSALPLGLISGLGHLVPYFGPIIGGVPAIVISVIQYGNFSQVPLILMLIAIVYIIDNGIVQPYVFSKSVDMHPIVIILLILIGSQLFGVAGMLFSIPLATVIRTAAKEIYYAFKNYKIARL